MEIPAEIADTICAISTPPGEGGIGIIRLSGPRSLAILDETFKSNKAQKPSNKELCLGYMYDPVSGEDIDEVLAVFMKAPGTYTREDVVEIQSHGGFAAQSAIMGLMLGQGARLAEPGEFTKRAYLNGRIDLIQAETVLDIIRSETDDELKYAVNYLKGGLSQKIIGFRNVLKDVLVAIEASIDFPDEDIKVDLSEHLASLRRTKEEINNLVSSYYEGKGLKSGFEVLILGRTNVGKSSFLNALASRQRAIVTNIPGTTRDLIEEILYIKGMKIRLIDTAGFRDPENIVEEEGIRRVKEKLAGADLIVWVLDGSQPYTTQDQQIYEEIRQYKKIVIINKSDLKEQFDLNTLSSLDIHTHVKVSSKFNSGLDEAKNSIYSCLLRESRSNTILITTVRHRDILKKVAINTEAVTKSLETLKDQEELCAFELQEALHHLGEITGETCPNEILDAIFSQFCIGK